MLADQFNYAVINLVPHLIGGDCTESAGRNFDCEIELSLVSNIDDHRIGAAIAGEKVCNFFDGLLGGRKPNAHRRTISKRFQPLQRKCEMSAAFIISYGMDFIHDYSFNIAQDCAASFRRQENIERFRSSNQNVWRTFQHRPALVH